MISLLISLHFNSMWSAHSYLHGFILSHFMVLILWNHLWYIMADAVGSVFECLSSPRIRARSDWFMVLFSDYFSICCLVLRLVEEGVGFAVVFIGCVFILSIKHSCWWHFRASWYKSTSVTVHLPEDSCSTLEFTQFFCLTISAQKSLKMTMPSSAPLKLLCNKCICHFTSNFLKSSDMRQFPDTGCRLHAQQTSLTHKRHTPIPYYMSDIKRWFPPHKHVR